jgi:hypothetical protein
MAVLVKKSKSKYLRINISYNNINLYNAIASAIFTIVNKYSSNLRTKIIKYENNNMYYLYYFILNNSIFEFSYLELLINNHLINKLDEKNIFIYYGCISKNQYYKELNLYQTLSEK